MVCLGLSRLICLDPFELMNSHILATMNLVLFRLFFSAS